MNASDADNETTQSSSIDAKPDEPSTAAPPWQRAYLIACCAIIGAALAYWLPHWAELPVLCYVPMQRRWTFDPPNTTPVITYVGLVLWGASGTAIGAALGALLGICWRRPLPTPALRMVGAWAITAFVMTGWYYTWNLWPF
jgi:hypothetical protein